MPEQEPEFLTFGGQAIMEGVMMRSPKYFSVACRAPDGRVVVRTEPLEKTWIGRQKWLMLPFLRGSWAILDSMILGTKTMRFAGEIQSDSKFGADIGEGKEPTERSDKIAKMAVGGAVIVGIAMGILLFQYLPNLIAQIFGTGAGDKKGTATNYLAELVKMILFLGYLGLIARMSVIKELFKYHGAEHKAINVHEAKQELNLENTAAITRLHPRCGTSFMVIVFMVGLLFLPLVPRYPITGQPGNVLLDSGARWLMELCLLPIIAGISYELLRLAGKNRDKPWVQMAFAPGLWSQKYLTTIEPEKKHLEVAIESLKAVMVAEETGELTITDDALETGAWPDGKPETAVAVSA
jgi:uncharacterized protein YqhQ